MSYTQTAAEARFNAARRSGMSVIVAHQVVVDEIQNHIVEAYANGLPTEQLDSILNMWTRVDPQEFERTRIKYKLVIEFTKGLFKGMCASRESHIQQEVGFVGGGGWLGSEYVVRECVDL